MFLLTRKVNILNIQRLERQMSKRNHFLTIKEWEIECVRRLMDNLQAYMPKAYELLFYYSFQIPKLGKEFDLLRIDDTTVINIELKSNSVPYSQVKKQLEQNRYYLSTLGRNIRSYTYISSEDKLLRLTSGGYIVEADWQTFCDDLSKQTNCYNGDIEDLFKEERYIISPLSEPDKFLKKEYFLTSQQKDIARKILGKIAGGVNCYQGFSGLPGTGKTLLLYDLAMTLSQKQRVAIVHCGAFSKELNHLDSRLKRIDFLDGRCSDKLGDLSVYSAILVDEAHLLDADVLVAIESTASKVPMPVVFCYDSEDIIKRSERGNIIIDKFESIPGFVGYKLTNRIRTNSELSAFVQCLMKGTNYNHRKEYPSVDVAYANDIGEANNILEYYMSAGYTFIYDKNVMISEYKENSSINIENAGRYEYDKVVMFMDEHFTYDDEGLGYDNKIADGESPVRNLFHGLNRAKKGIAIVVKYNEEVFDILLNILQGPNKN